MVEGIDALGRSLLGRQDTFREQREDDIKKQRRRAKTQALLGGVLKFADNAAREKYDSWFGNEASRSVSRLIKKQKELIGNRDSYLTELRASGKTPLAYEMDLVEKDLTSDVLGKRILFFNDLSKDKQNNILYGTDGNSGLYKTIAQQRLAARDEWGKNLQNYDPDTAIQNWKKVNPNSKNLVGAAVDFFKGKRIFGSDKTNNDSLVAERLKEIQNDDAQLELYLSKRQMGFDTDKAIADINETLRLEDKEGLLRRIGTRIGNPKEKTYTSVINGETFETKVFVADYELESGDIQRREIPISGGNYSQEEIERSQEYWDRKYTPKVEDYTYTDPLTKRTSKRRRTYRVTPDGDQLTWTVEISYLEPENEAIIASEMPEYVDKELVASSYNAFESNFGNVFRFDKRTDDYLSSDLNAVKGGTASQAAQTLKNNIGISQAKTVHNLMTDYGYLNQIFRGEQISQIATQLQVMDTYIQAELEEREGGARTFKGHSQENIDPAKLLIAIDLLRANGRLATDKQGVALSDNRLQDIVEAFSIVENGGRSFSFNRAEQGARYFDENEVDEIIKLRNIIKKLDDKNPDRLSLLDGRYGVIDDTFDQVGPPEELFATAYDLMIKQRTESDLKRKVPDRLTGSERFETPGDPPPPAPVTPQDRQILDEFNLSNGDSVSIDTGQVDRFNRPAVRTLTYDNGQVTVDTPNRPTQGGGSVFKPLTIDDIPDGPIKNYLAAKQQQYQANIQQLRDLGLKGDDLTSRNLRPGGRFNSQISKLKTQNNQITRILNIDDSALSFLPGMFNIRNRDARVDFFLGKDSSSLLSKTNKNVTNREEDSKQVTKTATVPSLIDKAVDQFSINNVSIAQINGISNIESSASKSLKSRTVSDSGHDAHGIMQIKTSTAAMPGFGIFNVFDIADILGISYDDNIKQQAFDQIKKNQAQGTFKPLTGQAAKGVIKLLQDPDINIAFGSNYLNYFADRYNGDMEKVYLAYNQGVSVADNFDGDRSKLNAEGRRYLERAEKEGIL